MADEPRRRLGRGLAALVGDAPITDDLRAPGQRKAPIEFLRPNPRNPRQAFGETDLADLAASIRQKGVLQPIVVRSVAGVADAYEIIAGERRWRAAQLANLTEVPIVLHEADDKEALEIAIVENIQRADLNPLEEARGYERLGADYGYSQNDISKIIGKSRSHIANTMRLLNLPDEVKKFVADGAISAGHARALLSVPNPEPLAKRIVSEGLTVRDIERLSQQKDGVKANAPKPAATKKDADTRAIEKSLTDGLGMKVGIRSEGEKGEIRIRYETLDQLDAICCRLLGATE